MQRAGIDEFAARIPLLSVLDEAERAPFARLIRLRSFRPRDVVVRQGDAGGGAYAIVSGYLKATALGPEGQEMLLSVMGPNEVFGELSLLDGHPRSATVTTLEAAVLATLERAAVLELLGRSPALALRLLSVLAERLRSITTRCENVACRELPQRLAGVLVGLADKHGQASGTDVVIPIRLSQQDLGSMVGSTRESVNKLLGEWKSRGVLRRDAGRVVIQDVSALRQITTP